MTLRDVHDGLRGEHYFCPDLYCCNCECRGCKRRWFAAGRPRSADCLEPGTPCPRPSLVLQGPQERYDDKAVRLAGVLRATLSEKDFALLVDMLGDKATDEILFKALLAT